MKLITACLLSILARTALGTPQDSLPSIAVLEFEARGVTQEEAAALADKFRYELLKTKAFQVMERSQMDLILKEQEFQLSGCVNQACAVEVGKFIAVRKIVTGSASKVGEILSLNAKLIDVETARIDRNVSEDCDCPLERVFTYTLQRLARKMAGEELAPELVEPQRGDASLFVVTVPEGARVHVDGKFMEGRTPSTFGNLPAGRHSVEARKGNLVARKEVDLQSRKVTRIALDLREAQSLLKVSSVPSDAEVYLGAPPSYKTRPLQLTPAIFEGLEGKSVTVWLFKVGYADTSFQANLDKLKTSEYTLELSPASMEAIDIQKRMVGKRNRRRVGGYISLSSLALLAGGGALYYLAHLDYEDARQAKSALEKSVIRSGPEYEAMLKENRDKSNSGDGKATASFLTGGLGAALMAVGLVLYF